MKAAVLYGREDMRVEMTTPRALHSGEARVAVEAALTCGTDLKVYKRGYHAKMITPPAVFGHELAGIISELAPDVHGWRIGDHVVVANSAPCGKCFYCHNHQENLCEDLQFLNGAYARSIVVPARLVQKNMVKLKPGTSFRDAALVEPLACVVQGVEDCQLKPGQEVLVIGSGPIGLMFTALAKHLGCIVTVAGRGEARLKAALRLGARQAIDIGRRVDLVKAVHAETSAAKMFDVVIEAVGKPEVWEAAFNLVRKGGLVNFFGGCAAGTTVTFDATRIHYSNLTLRASFHHTPRTIRRALEFIERGVIHARDFVDGEWPLSQLPELFKNMAAGNKAVKTFIRVHD
jgi:L-iditol 2-dehydrogenase